MELNELLPHIITDNELHARWLNSLSLMENTGARKISAGEDLRTLTLIILKHAAEEHRHAYFLKKQIEKTGIACPTYADEYLLAPISSKHYLHQLDISVSRYLKDALDLNGKELRFTAYLLVTYAIELRADELYPQYQTALENAGSKINVKSIILEEEGHLEEMINQLEEFLPNWKHHAQRAVELESNLFANWVTALATNLVLQ